MEEEAQPVDLVEEYNKYVDRKKERKIGFTMRVGGGRSGVLDRRNWDSYIVNKKEVRISPRQGLELMGFPKSFKFPVSNSQALKQLGNSVAVNVIKEIGKKTLDHLKLYKNQLLINLIISLISSDPA